MPDDTEYCRRCGGWNTVWCAPSPLWNKVMRGNDINGETQFSDLVCVRCFIELAEETGIGGQWRLTVNPLPDDLVYETPSGRVWDWDRWLWVQDEAEGCERCDWTGWLDDESACGDPEHCSPMYACPCNPEGL